MGEKVCQSTISHGWTAGGEVIDKFPLRYVRGMKKGIGAVERTRGKNHPSNNALNDEMNCQLYRGMVSNIGHRRNASEQCQAVAKESAQVNSPDEMPDMRSIGSLVL